jgi:hypothetical protein
MYGAIWSECIWQLADAKQSAVKFIISDHPVTVYNRDFFPGSAMCQSFGDPDIRYVATHTYFPLCLERVLILTNLSWVRNPYQSERKVRPNPDLFQNTLFKYTRIQTRRELTEEEVLKINYITKCRAHRYVAAADVDWLYPERHLRTTHWSKLDAGYLLMPDPREVHMGGEVIIGYGNGRADSFSEYGHKPWQRGYEDKNRMAEESKALQRFQAEFSVMQGPICRGSSHQFWQNEDGPHVFGDEYHQHQLDLHKRLTGNARQRR